MDPPARRVDSSYPETGQSAAAVAGTGIGIGIGIGGTGIRTGIGIGGEKPIKKQDAPHQTKYQGKKPSLSPSSMTIYERGMHHLAAREAKLKRMKEQMMNSCTFTPVINRTRNSVTRTTPATQASTPFTPRMTMRQIQNQTKSPSHSLETSSDGSGRIQRLYQDGVRLRQSRPVSQRHERELREKRIFERQRGDCTFRPKIWTKPYITPQKKMTPQREKSIHNPPLRVVTTHAPSTPKGTSRFPHVLISPLRDPTVAEQLEIDTIGPSLAERTEYGSI